GLEIRDRLAGRDEFTLIELDERYRRDRDARRNALRSADFAILCLPDEAARESVTLAEESDLRIIDASTAHRTDPQWTYGFAELTEGQRAAIAGADRVANPGCYAVAFIALVRPLVEAGLLAADARLAVHAASGYSGGGRAMIAEFEQSHPSAFRSYALGLDHKHLPEMQRHAGLAYPPLFSPAVVDAYRGMLVEIPLGQEILASGVRLDDLVPAYREHYATSRGVRVASPEEIDAMTQLAIEGCAESDRLDILVFANQRTGQARLCARLDNLGKGAAGSAVQNLNLMAGVDEHRGLRL
ncbi:MAG: N-acetyl-gamma-glutamyl-phosphate reductase, partial [Sphingomonadales bacterium]|nr:N-acetyl-gamma-glutamyl-phosphate reductase [Sphingomonadales bacterium]